jgi:Tfp pilus assembly protein PilF
MNRIVTRPHIFFALAALAVSTTGCASWLPHKGEQPTITEARQQRHEAAVLAFERQRDQALLEAAIERWQHGDLGGCEARLRSLVARRPDFCDAHLQLAELAWSCENSQEAEAEYRLALQLAPDRADLHHALGLLLEATGRTAEAQQHLARAGELDPESELYRPAAATTAPTARTAAVESGIAR